MFRIMTSLFKYVVWLVVIFIMLHYTQDKEMLERTAYIAVGVVAADLVMLLVEFIHDVVTGAKHTSLKLKQKIQQKKLEKAEKRGAKRGAQEAKAAQVEKEKKAKEQADKQKQAQLLKDEQQKRMELEKELRRRDKQDGKQRPVIDQPPQQQAITEGVIPIALTDTISDFSEKGKNLIGRITDSAKKFMFDDDDID